MSAGNAFFQGGQIGFRFLKLDVLASRIGTEEVPLRFMIGIMLGFPFAFLYIMLPKHKKTFKHFYITMAGLFISYFCFGSDCVYNLISVMVSYVSLVLFGGTIHNVIFAFVFQMSYMFGSYIIFASDGYDIKWTTPQCIMCLRLIGLSWDCYDGKQKKETLRADLQKTCYEGTPTLLEVTGYSYFFGAFMAGPQFSFQRYTKFVNCTLIDEEGMKTYSKRFVDAAERFFGGVVILVIFFTFDSKYPFDAMTKPAFLESSHFARCTYMTIAYHVHFCKYVSIWYFCESVCMMTGLSYNGVKNDGQSLWNGVCNFQTRKCLTGPFFQDMLESFNINTSQWSSRYVFKRLMFLGNKTLSQLLTLIFLSLWHGFYIGYPILFVIEFFLLKCEREISSLLRVFFNTTYSELPLYLRFPLRVFGALFKAYACAFAATAFVLLRWRRIKLAYASVSYWLFIWLVVCLFVVTPILSQIVKAKKSMILETSSYIGAVATYSGINEANLRFLLGLFLGFPLSFNYLHISKYSANVKHIYFTICGLAINYFVFGWDSMHSLFSVVFTYATSLLFGGTALNVVLTLVFQTTYLFVGYILNTYSGGYHIRWTTPQCVLCMRLIGLVWDMYDGQQKEEKLSEDQLRHRVASIPSIAEFFGFSYCFCGFLSGPQFSFYRYHNFVHGTLIKSEAGDCSARYIESLKRFIAVFGVIVIYKTFAGYYNADFLFTNAYLEKSFLLRITDMSLIYYVQFTRYVIVWWISESICTLIGISYNGTDEHGNSKWDGAQNFKLGQFVFGGFFQDIIESFNINTNIWSGRYIFRRLKFVGSKPASHVLTLLYLAIWHGYHIGYFMMFAMEFLIMVVERQVCSVCKKLSGKSFCELPTIMKACIQCAGAILKFYMCGFFVGSFILLRWKKIKLAYGDVYYWPIVMMMLWLLFVGPALRALAKTKPSKLISEVKKEK